MSKFLRVLLSTALAAVSLTAIQIQAAQATPGPFACTPDFYQASGGNMLHLDTGTFTYNGMSGSTNLSGLNAIGYNTADNYIYGISGGNLYKISDDGSHGSPIALNGTPSDTGGTFIGDNRMLTNDTSGNFTTIDLTTTPPTVATFPDTGSTWKAADIAFDPTRRVAYGLDGNTLYIATFDTGLTTLAVTTKTFSNNYNTADNWGAAYVDRDGNAYFFDNDTAELVSVTLADLQSAAATITATHVASANAPSSPNDGASCPNAISPMAAASPSPTPTPPAPAPTYPVYFDGNGGGPNPATQSYNSNICISLPAGPTRPGYEFVGWFVAPDAHSLLPSSYCPTGTDAITLYAHWAPSSYLLNYNSQGGSAVPSSSYTTGSSVTLAAGPTKPGYTFAGWAISPDGGSTLASPLTPAAGGLTVYARWTANNYTLKYDSQGGTEVPSATFQTGGTVTLGAAPTRKGYAFTGWSVTANAAAGTPALTSPYAPGVNSDVTVYAQWKANSYKVSFDSQGGATVADSSYQTGACFDLPAAPSREGYSFTGWFAAASGGTALASPYCATELGDLTLFAQWTKNAPVKRPPVTVTISGFADGSPVLTKAIKKQIDAFLKQYSDYKNIECIGYTEGPTVLKTDYALSRGRALNSCSYATLQAAGGIGKGLRKLPAKAGQETVEASHLRRVTITLTD